MKRAPDPVFSFAHVASIMTAAIEASGYWPKAEVRPAVEQFLRAEGRGNCRPYAALTIGASRLGDDEFELLIVGPRLGRPQHERLHLVWSNPGEPLRRRRKRPALRGVK